MPKYNVTADDTLVLNDRVFTDFADGDTIDIAPSADAIGMTTGKNQNTIFSENAQGDNATVTLRIMRGSDDDQYLQGLQASTDQDFASTVLLNGQFVKRLGDGEGNVRRDVHTLQGGMVKRRVPVKENVSGSTEQGVSVWTIGFANVVRSIQ